MYQEFSTTVESSCMFQVIFKVLGVDTAGVELYRPPAWEANTLPLEAIPLLRKRKRENTRNKKGDDRTTTNESEFVFHYYNSQPHTADTGQV